MKSAHNQKYFTSKIILLGFLGMIVVGAGLLMLPFATVGEGSASYADALFTATSAVCVTGLLAQDTATYWSGFGQAVILLLIQIGGMGVVTMAVSITRLSGRRIGLMQRSTMQEAIAAPKVGGIVRLTSFILRTSLVIELAGAAILAPVFIEEFGVLKGLWYALFHSVSAFCNAGFDLMGVKGAYSSLTSYVGHPVVNIVLILLIIIGGIGFMTWDDIRTNTYHLRRYRLQSKVILSVTAVLVVLPALYFFFVEFSGEAWSGMSLSERIYASLFQAVTPRTAGFNSVELGAFSGVGKAIILLLMLIGGSPGSTAGGMKTTTVAVLLTSALAVFRRRQEAEMFGRRLQESALRHAATILLMYLTLFLSGGLIISSVEGLPIMACLFETASAIGTVGLSLGLTPHLTLLSKLVLIVLMIFGRVGGLTLIFAALSGRHPHVSQLPQESVTVG